MGSDGGQETEAMVRRRVAIAGIATVVGIAALYSGSGRISGRFFGIGTSSDCQITEWQEGDLSPIRVDCRWPIPSARLHAMLSNVEDQEKLFSGLAESTVVQEAVQEGSPCRAVRQVHTGPGIADREVIVEWCVEEVANGYRYYWHKARDQSAATGTRVEVAHDSGFWEVTADGAASRVIYEIRYLPGGDVPPFLVRMFQSKAIKTSVDEFRMAAEAGSRLVQAQ